MSKIDLFYANSRIRANAILRDSKRRIGLPEEEQPIQQMMPAPLPQLSPDMRPPSMNPPAAGGMNNAQTGRLLDR